MKAFTITPPSLRRAGPRQRTPGDDCLSPAHCGDVRESKASRCTDRTASSRHPGANCGDAIWRVAGPTRVLPRGALSSDRALCWRALVGRARTDREFPAGADGTAVDHVGRLWLDSG